MADRSLLRLIEPVSKKGLQQKAVEVMIGIIDLIKLSKAQQKREMRKLVTYARQWATPERLQLIADNPCTA